MISLCIFCSLSCYALMCVLTETYRKAMTIWQVVLGCLAVFFCATCVLPLKAAAILPRKLTAPHVSTRRASPPLPVTPYSRLFTIYRTIVTVQPQNRLSGFEPRVSKKAHTTPDVVFLCAKHGHIQVMVGRVGQPKGWPDPS